MQFEGLPPSHVSEGRGWPIGLDGMLDFTTEVSIVPTTFPFEKCEGDDCFGVAFESHFDSNLASEIDLGGLPARKGRPTILSIPLNENQ